MKNTLLGPQILTLICALFLLSLPTACSRPKSNPASDSRPNILLILVDDLGYSDLSYNGATQISTPHIDRLAQEGVIFSNGYAAHPDCAPSRAGLLTGRSPARFGLERNLPYVPFDVWQGLPVKEETIASHLRRVGYRTGMVGKWHLGAAPPFHPLERGFDSFHGFLGGGHSYFDIDPRRSPPNEYLLPLDKDGANAGFSGYLTDALTDYALDFVKKDTDRPFFLYLSYNAPHTPLQAPKEIVGKYDHIEDKDRRRYLAMIDSLNHNVGRLRSVLEEAGEWDNTLTFFLSDNGGEVWGGADWADNSPLRGGKGSLYEGGIRVPFVSSWPAGWPAGQTFEPIVSSLDIAATALSLAGAAPAPSLPLDGANLDPFVRGVEPGPPHQALFWRKMSFAKGSESENAYAVRAADVKLVKSDSHEAALFDLRADPAETHDLVHDDLDTVVRLAALWNDWNSQNSTPFVADSKNYWITVREVARIRYEDVVRWGATHPPFQIRIPFPPPPSRPVVGNAPAPPAGLTAEGVDRGIILRWSNPGDSGITGYQFRLRSLDDRGGWRPWINMDGRRLAANRLLTEMTNRKSYLLTGLTNGAIYHVQLRALSAEGEGEPSEAVAFPAIPGRGSPVFPPTLPGAVATADGRIRLTWSKPNDDSIADYQFRLRSLRDRDWWPWRDLESNSDPVAHTHTLHDLTPGEWYSVQLRAQYANGSSLPVEVTAASSG